MKQAYILHMFKTLCHGIILLLVNGLCAQTKTLDVIEFGVSKSEMSHRISTTLSETGVNEKDHKGRKMLAPISPDYRGGTISFTLKTDPELQNYISVKFWGSESDESTIVLFINGLQVGYRHLGDIDLLHRGNGQNPALGKYYYRTLPLPLQVTKGKKEVTLEFRSYGPTFDYGDTFEKYQKNMVAPSCLIYKAYTHIAPYFDGGSKEDVAAVSGVFPTRKGPGIEVLAAVKERVNKEFTAILSKPEVSQLEAWFLADAYNVNWTVAFKNKEVASKIIKSLDKFYIDLKANPDLIFKEPSVYNPDWLNAGPYARCVRMLWNEIAPKLSENVEGISRREAWSYVFEAHLAYATTHRRQYTNQSMIIDMFMYDSNKALMLINPAKALPEYQTLKYLYESVGLTPWLGLETPAGPQKPLGDNYWQITDKGLTKELGFVGYYGEVLDWVVDMYRTTALPGQPETGDPKIRLQLLKMMRARLNFRYPEADAQGFKAMLAEAVIGWRDGNHFPGDVLYGDRGIAWDATPLMTAATTLDPKAVAVAQQMINDNQFFNILEDKMKLPGLRVTKSLLHIPDEYELIMAQPQNNTNLPMTAEMPDYVFSDEEDGVVAIKNGEEILYASLYWRARNAVNNLAQLHYITKNKQNIAIVYLTSKFEPSGLEYTRQNWVNLAFAGFREFYPKDIVSANAGEKLPIAKIPDGVVFKPGDENVYAGRADYYQIEYANYFIVMNTTKDKVFDVKVPETFAKGKNLVTGEMLKGNTKMQLKPRTTAVIFK